MGKQEGEGMKSAVRKTAILFLVFSILAAPASFAWKIGKKCIPPKTFSPDGIPMSNGFNLVSCPAGYDPDVKEGPTGWRDPGAEPGEMMKAESIDHFLQVLNFQRKEGWGHGDS
jgi:hypothetical protein